MEYVAGRRQNHAVDVANVLAADHFNRGAQRVGLAEVIHPVLPEPIPDKRQRDDPVRRGNPVTIGRHQPHEQVARFLERVIQREGKRHDEHRDNENQGQARRQGRATLATTHQPGVDRPACEADDQGRKPGDDEVTEKIDDRSQKQDQQEPYDQMDRQNWQHQVSFRIGLPSRHA